jgi:DNA-binding XRE family transcriptional regulator
MSELQDKYCLGSTFGCLTPRWLFNTVLAVFYLTKAFLQYIYWLDSIYLVEATLPKTIKPIPTPVQSGPLDAETLGKFIRARRTQSGMGMHEAAAFCGVAVDTLTKIETAKGDVKLSSILTVCRMLGINLKVEAWEE